MKPICINCGKQIEGRRRRKFCTNACQGTHTHKLSVSEWRSGTRCGHLGKAKCVAPFVRRYMFEKTGGKCCKCGWNTPHQKTGKAPLDVNHIDGDASNTIESNLELICPNCHALTDNYKNHNKVRGKRIR